MHVWSGRSSDFKKRNVSSGQGPASSLTYPAILVLEFLSIRNESLNRFTLGVPSASFLKTFNFLDYPTCLASVGHS